MVIYLFIFSCVTPPMENYNFDNEFEFVQFTKFCNSHIQFNVLIMSILFHHFFIQYYPLYRSTKLHHVHHHSMVELSIVYFFVLPSMNRHVVNLVSMCLDYRMCGRIPISFEWNHHRLNLSTIYKSLCILRHVLHMSL